MADKPKKSTYVRNTTIAQDISDSIRMGSSLVGGMVGDAARALKGRKAQIDDAVDDATLDRTRARQHHDYE